MLQLTLSQRTALVTVDTARAVRGVDAETILAEVDCGGLAWAFDIGRQPGGSDVDRRRELRIWAPCLDATGAQPEGGARAVLDQVIGTHRGTLRGSEVERLLCCSAAHVKALHESGELRGEIVGRTRHITRESLAEFLKRRRVV